MSDPLMVTVPSEPVAADETFLGYRIFENVRRPNVGGRRCSPADNSFVAIDRVIGKGGLGFLLRRAHPCDTGDAIIADFHDRPLASVGIEVLDAPEDADGHVNVVVSACPGVRLRAIAEKSAANGRAIAPEIVWHLVNRTAAIAAEWDRAGIDPADTFIGFDGSVHLFPVMPVCQNTEAPSYVGTEVWDSFLVSATPESLTQLVCGTLPAPFFPAARAAALRAAGIAVPAQAASVIPPIVEQLLAQPRTSTDARGPLAALVRSLFPETLERHRRIHAEL